MKDDNDTEEKAQDAARAKSADPVRKWTLIVFGACVILMAYYLIADRVTPYTTQARVHALVVPIAPEVSGIVTDVAVASNLPGSKATGARGTDCKSRRCNCV